jgi:hypothetical protein
MDWLYFQMPMKRNLDPKRLQKMRWTVFDVRLVAVVKYRWLESLMLLKDTPKTSRTN